MDTNNLLLKYTCVIMKEDEIIFTSNEKGVKPLLDFYRQYGIVENLCVVDKIMGRGAILLAKLIGAEKIITPIISIDALSLAKEYGMKVEYEKVVDYIVNRDNTGRCPIESSVLGISDVNQGYEIILKTLQKLKS